jgi:hypothetical protein
MSDKNNTIIEEMINLLMDFDNDPNFKGIEFDELERIAKQNIRKKKT